MSQENSIKKIAVYCGSSSGTNPAFTALAHKLGHEIVERGYGLVYGGGNVGLMGEIARTIIEEDGEVIGIIPEFLMKEEVGLAEGTELHVVPDMHTRKKMIADMSDAFIAMPGGFGTFEEIFEALTWAQLKLHDKPCALLNIDGFYDGLIGFIEHAIDQGFIHKANRALLLTSDNPADLLDQLENYQTPLFDKTAFAKQMSNKHKH